MSATLLLLAGVLLVGGFGSCLLGACRGGPVARLVALELGSVVAVLVLLLLSAGYGRSSYQDVGLVLAIVSFAGSLVYARFLERWL